MRAQYLILIVALACCKLAYAPVDGSQVLNDSTMSILPEDARSFLVIYNSAEVDQKAILEIYYAVLDHNGDIISLEKPKKIVGFWKYDSGTYYFSPIRGDSGMSIYFGDLFIQRDLEARRRGVFQLRHINEGQEEIVLRAGDPAQVVERFNTGEKLELEEMFLLHDRI